MIPLRHNVPLPDQEKGILLTLLYFDIFHYPLTENEIARFSPVALKEDWQRSLVHLIDKKSIYHLNGFYSLHNDSFLASRRSAGNVLAQKKMNVARKFSRLIS